MSGVGVLAPFLYVRAWEDQAIYEISLACGPAHIGQTSKCVNDRLRERMSSLRNTRNGNLVLYCDRRGGVPSLDDSNTPARERDGVEREVIEAFHMEERAMDPESDPDPWP